MGLVLGTNCGFVETAPVTDPNDSTGTALDGYQYGLRDDTPSGTNLVVTEIGIWLENESNEPETEFDVGIYTDNSGTPDDLLDGESRNNTKPDSFSTGWMVVDGLNISVSASTTYYIGLQMDAISTDDQKTNYNHEANNESRLLVPPNTALQETWSGTTYDDRRIAFYALVEEAPATGTNQFINIGDDFKQISELYINIGDSWKAISEMFINIGDAWKPAVT